MTIHSVRCFVLLAGLEEKKRLCLQGGAKLYSPVVSVMQRRCHSMEALAAEEEPKGCRRVDQSFRLGDL
jgi:hypothetical protein